MFNTLEPQKGNLLLAEPFMHDSNFERAVILLCEHSTQSGSMGLVVNQPSVMLLSDVVPELNNLDFPLFIGGPVGLDSLFYIHQVPHKIDGSSAISADLYLGGNFEQVKILLQEKILHSQE